MEREKWIDSIRFIAIEVVFLVHFIAACAPQISVLWHKGLSGIILCGITGKSAVAMFAVILGYFATKEGTKEGFSLSHYITKRYIRFSIAILCTLGLIIILSYGMKMSFLYDGENMESTNFLLNISDVSLKNILLDSFFFDETIFPLLWCMKSFFISSIISAVISSINRGGAKTEVEML